MIYPTARAVLLTLIGAPIAVAVGIAAPAFWWVGPAWIAFVAILVFADSVFGASARDASGVVEAPPMLGAGTRRWLDASVRFARGAPQRLETALEASPLIALSPARAQASVQQNGARAAFEATTVRRGAAKLETLWLRWQGPLGLLWKQRKEKLDHTIAVVPDTDAVKDEALRLFSRTAIHGMKPQTERSDGTEFDALTEYMPGMDRRSIDWKRSAKHRKLLAKEYQAERNHHIMFAIDSGRLMCEPLGGMARIDRALNAALMLTYVSLRMGDRVGLFAFDSRPRLTTPTVAGAPAFRVLQRLTASIDYSTEETNFTLALTELARDLKRRSLVVIFTDFVDTTSAELMIENVGRLLKRHHVLFVTFKDVDLEGMRERAPEVPEDVSRAVIAHTLLKERDLVISRLQRLGVQVLDAPLERIGPALINSYLDIKRRDIL